MKALIDGEVFLEDVIEARSMMERMRGLLGRKGLPAGTGMLIDPCGSIHTFYMKFDLDVVFLDSEDRVVKLQKSIGPGRMAFGGYSARKILEMESGKVDMQRIREGSQVKFAS